MVWLRHLTCFLCLALTLCLAPLVADARPLLMEGKSTLYQKVLTRPDAQLRDAPSTGDVGEMLTPFELFYVFAEREADGRQWLQVGRSIEGDPDGWLETDQTVEWKQTIVAAFTNPSDRERTLVYSSIAELEEVVSREDAGSRIPQLRASAIANALSAQDPVVSIEPEAHIAIDEQFYILPILDHKTVRLPTTRRAARLLEIASVPRDAPRPTLSPEEALRDFRIGIVFVLDTTNSMGPYIDEVRATVENLKRRIGSSPEGERVRFGLVGFRDNTSLVPELEYVSKPFLPLSVDATSDQFLQAISNVNAATASSVGFNEDVVAGVKSAIDDMNWEPFGGRFVIVVTDAGPREPGQLAKHGALDVGELKSLLDENNMTASVLHLKTAAGQTDHSFAEDRFRQLAATAQGVNLYNAVPDGNIQAFADAVNRLSDQIVSLIDDTIQGQLSSMQASSGPQQAVAAAGRAMQMAWLGRMTGTQAPTLIRGAVSDRDPLDRSVVPIEARLMISRNQLSTMRDVMVEMTDLIDPSVGSDQFFEQLRSAVARITRNQGALDTVNTLGDALGEYLQDLPYESDVIGINEQQWLQMSAPAERDFINNISSKLVALEAIYDDPSRWVALYEGQDGGEHVTTIPLDLLP